MGFFLHIGKSSLRTSHWSYRKNSKVRHHPFEESETIQLSSSPQSSQSQTSVKCPSNFSEFLPSSQPTSSDDNPPERKRARETIDQLVGTSPVKPRRLDTQSYVEEKYRKIQDMIKTRFEEEFAVKINNQEHEDYVCILENLKATFQAETCRETKMKLIRVLPDTWSVVKIKEKLGAPTYLIRHTENKICSSKTIMKPGNRPLRPDAVQIIKNFYENDDNSRQLAGMRNFVVIKLDDGVKIRVQKKLLMCNLELYTSFKIQHPDIGVGFSKFCDLRPQHCVLAGAPRTRATCICMIHQNVNLMLEDGAPAQFKNKNAFTNLVYHLRDFGRPAKWNFFPTAHGKTASDGRGGSFKRNARRTSLQMSSTTNAINTLQALYQWAVSKEKKMQFCFIPLAEYKKNRKFLESRTSRASTIVGTKKFHSIEPEGDDSVKCKAYSSFENLEVIKMLRKEESS